MIVVGGEIDVKYGENGEKALLTGSGEFWVAEAWVPVAVAAWPAPSPEPHTLIPVHNLCPFKLGSRLERCGTPSSSGSRERRGRRRGPDRSRVAATDEPLARLARRNC